jgi:hypothetical protein
MYKYMYVRRYAREIHQVVDYARVSGDSTYNDVPREYKIVDDRTTQDSYAK